MQILKDKYPKGVHLIHVSREDSFDEHPELIQAVIDKDYDTLNDKIHDRYYYDIDYSYYLEGIPEEDHDEARERLDENNKSDPLKDLIGNTSKIKMRIEMHSNYDCGMSNHLHGGDYTYKEDFFGSAIKGLGINPQQVKKLLTDSGNTCHGPRPKRKDHAYITAQDFLSEHLETTAGRVPSFAVSIDLMDLYESGTLDKITIKAGTAFGLMNSRVGTCSCFDATLKKDMTVSLTTVSDDDRAIKRGLVSDEDGYGIDEICGMTDNFWNKGSFIIH